MPKKIVLNTSYTWEGVTVGPSIDGKPVIAPDSFPESLGVKGQPVESITQEQADDLAARGETTPPRNVPGVDPQTSGLRAEFTANEFLAAVAARGVSFPATGANGAVTLGDVFVALQADPPAESPNAAPSAPPSPAQGMDDGPAGAMEVSRTSLAEQYAAQQAAAAAMQGEGEGADADASGASAITGGDVTPGGSADAATGAGLPSSGAGQPSSSAGQADSTAGTPDSGAGQPTGTP